VKLCGSLVIGSIVVGAGVLLAACGGQFSGSTVAEQTTSWARQTGFLAAIGSLHDDLARVAQAIRQGDPPPSLRTDCDVLVTDALSANQNLPAPDDTLSKSLSQAYSTAADAGRDCLRGAGTHLSPLLARSGIERARAQVELVEAEARFDSVTTGSPVPT
jgi:hypothetical protein